MGNDLELNHLKYFYYTVLEGGVAQAAHRLCVQQPVVSKMLKSLEENLGQPLFWKKGRSKSLTDYGQLIFRHCQVVFKEIGKIQQISENPLEIKGVFNLGAAEPIINGLFAPVFAKLIDQFPNLNFNVYTTTQTQLLNMISEGQLELGCFFYAPNILADLEVVKSIPFRFRLVVKASEAKNKKVIQSFIGSREIDDLSTHKFPTVELMRKTFPETRITFSSNSIHLHKQLVKLGKGVSIMPEFMVKKELSSGQFVDLYPKKKLEWDLMIIKRKSELPSLPAQSFLSLWDEST
ncbi:MAG: LysR family transcriptional regulator [Bdellovibrionales bacterium]|nr:LysR family transcriptional regulator [Bdellovibrionales bacterium]